MEPRCISDADPRINRVIQTAAMERARELKRLIYWRTRVAVRARVYGRQQTLHPPHEHLRVRRRSQRVRGAGGHRRIALLPAVHAAALLQLQQCRRRLDRQLRGKIKLNT